jgi:hypothetical protein
MLATLHRLHRLGFATVLATAAIAACASSASPTAISGASDHPAATATATPAATAGATVTPALTPAPTPTATPNPTPTAPPLTAVKPRMLPGALPAGLIGTWEVIGTPGQFIVFGAHQFGGYNVVTDVAHGPAGASGDLLSVERSNGPCSTANGPRFGVIGMYRWVLVSPTELRTYGVSGDPCPRAGSLKAGDLTLVSRSTAGLP